MEQRIQFKLLCIIIFQRLKTKVHEFARTTGYSKVEAFMMLLTVSLLNITWCCLCSRGVNFSINLPFHTNLHPVRTCSNLFDPLQGPFDSQRYRCMHRRFSQSRMLTITFTIVKVKYFGDQPTTNANYF